MIQKVVSKLNLNSKCA